MSQQALRGETPWFVGHDPQTKLKYDSDYAPRVEARYACPKGHDFEVPFADDVEAPEKWECRLHGVEGRNLDAAASDKKVKAPRTHWDMLLERRSIPELEVLLDEALNARARARRVDRQAAS